MAQAFSRFQPAGKQGVIPNSKDSLGLKVPKRIAVFVGCVRLMFCCRLVWRCRYYMQHSRKVWSLLLTALVIGTGNIHAAGGLERSFLHPPDSARPWVYWIWMNGNVTSNGITADLEAMQRVGIGGVLMMDVDQGTPPGAVRFGSQQWRDLFKHVCAEAHRLGLQINMNNDPGWCGSGGPWVTPELSMQEVTWSETNIKGPGLLRQLLPEPPSNEGFYRDIAVLAFPTLQGDDVNMRDFSPRFTISGQSGEHNEAGLLGPSASKPLLLPQPAPEKPSWLQVEFAEPFTARQMVLRMDLKAFEVCHGILEASEDGSRFATIREFDAESLTLRAGFAPVTARYFRLLFQRRNPELKQLSITALELSPRFRIEHIEPKAFFVRKHEFPGPNEFPLKGSYPQIPESLSIARGSMVNLSSSMGVDGQLDWQVPPGKWTVVRFGHTSNGKDNHPAPQGGHGLECDKLRKDGVQTVFNGLIKNLLVDNKRYVPNTFVSTHIDSWEVDAQNWTEHFRDEFRWRRGYDLLPLLPVITGRVVSSLDISERFLWDFRQTIADLMLENYAKEWQRLGHANGLRLSIEAYDSEPSDDLSYALGADEPMGEFWMWPPYEMDYSCDEMASAAHVSGKRIVGVEAFTSTSSERWLAHPFTAKPFGDWAFCEGINRLVIHRYTHQPWTNPNRKPGMSMGPFGLHYERTQTWWDYSRPWHEYLARCQFLLRQGLYVADICYVAAEDVPQHWKVPFESKDRLGYDYDVCPARTVIETMSVKNGRVVLPDGMSYRLLVLSDEERMTPELLAKVRELVRGGATVVGRRPIRSPSLVGFPGCDEELNRLADELWGSGGRNAAGEHAFGKGKVVWGQSPRQVLADRGVPKDFEPLDHRASEAFRYIHRTVSGTELYFVANNKLEPVESVCAFRVQGRRPEVWRPETGQIENLAIYDITNGTTRLPLRLEPCGSAFVIFRSAAAAPSARLAVLNRNQQKLVDLRAASGMNNSTSSGSSLAEQLDSAQAEGESSTFTMAVWAKPAVDVPLPEEANFGESAYNVDRNDALFPPPGHEVYGSPEHAGAGLDIGRNGICVIEHAPFYFGPVLVWATPVTNWTHIAVVYRSGRPSLYLNGKPVHEGLQSTFIVHSGVGAKHRRGIFPFQGSLGDFYGAPRALSEKEVTELMGAMPIPKVAPSLPSITVAREPSGSLVARAWENGNYTAETDSGRQAVLTVTNLPKPIELDGPWTLKFPPSQGAPNQVTLDHLLSWSECEDDAIKHFSGTATYEKSFEVPGDLLGTNHEIFLDLGRVSVMAGLELNGKDLGILWKPPFRVNLAGVLKEGENHLRISVVNLWVNRMIGDESLPADSDRNPDGALKSWPEWLKEHQPNPSGRFTFSTWPLWKKDEPLRSSGLLGPVRLLAARVVSLKTEK